MSSKKWVLVFLVTVLVLAALLAALNLAVDPFGAFGDRLLSWFSYDETNNPRVAKFSYLEQHHDEYDSYILGCSSTSSFPVDAFNEAMTPAFTISSCTARICATAKRSRGIWWSITRSKTSF